jgi:hypothetical protein
LNPAQGDLFGDRLYLQDDRLVIGAQAASFKHPYTGNDVTNGGAVYIYEREHGGLYWSYQAKLIALDAMGGNYFGENFALDGARTVIGARNDNEKQYDTDGNGGTYTGTAYVFKQFSGKWSQQQKLIAHDMLVSFHPSNCCYLLISFSSI